MEAHPPQRGHGQCASKGQCVNWTITPNTAANANVADLFYYGTRGLVFVGQYYNTFRIYPSSP